MTELASIGDLCDVLGGATPSKKETAYFEGEIPWATVRDMGAEKLTETEFKITTEALASCSSSLVPSGNVIIATRVGLGKTCLLAQDTAINQDLRGLVPREPSRLDRKYLFYCMKALAPKIVAAGTGATVQGVRLPFVKQLQIPLPPLDEQRRIVAKLDEEFRELSRAVETTIQQTSLAHEALGVSRSRLFTSQAPGVTARAFDKLVGPVATGPFGSLLHASDYVTDGFPLINPVNIQGSKVVPMSNKTVNAETRERLSSYILREGDVVVARRGELGRCAVVGTSESGWICGTGCFFVRPNGSVNPEYVANMIRTSGYKMLLERSSTGTTMSNLSNKRFAEVQVALPARTRQDRAVREFEAISGLLKDLKVLKADRLHSLSLLRKSILSAQVG